MDRKYDLLHVTCYYTVLTLTFVTCCFVVIAGAFIKEHQYVVPFFGTVTLKKSNTKSLIAWFHSLDKAATLVVKQYNFVL